ncbi:pyridoxal phosphate-dependent decarboxylase family protein [Bacillus sp. B1-b2]|uniref:pyridoxal phosphate-dependent decarboxylase family protein n=1 Tax=Bacillus sp. B1-b2 TaxID=2653201 RepID=UPI001261B436|nr:pyridoxal-dependent decarboxylase [Bacillus sp. B1-b2]KAB7672012.1 aspartate aminotransferase family protein [Bacillus sp. B1-b2]
MDLQNIQKLFPSDDGNVDQQQHLLDLITGLIKELDLNKNTEKSILGETKNRDDDFYRTLIEQSAVPQSGKEMTKVLEDLLDLVQGHPYHTHRFVSNVLPMASIPGILGVLTTILVNGNNLWDVYGPAGAEAEVKVVSMMSKLVGYDHTKSFGYTTWGGQGAVFTGLRLAIAKQFPKAKEEGLPSNLYCFASEGAHYSLLKSVEATGIGSNHLIRVKTTADHSMDIQDLRKKMEEVLSAGGIPIYIVATTGTTDSFGIDNVKEIKDVIDSLKETHPLHDVHVHADSALGGFYTLFNSYDFETNPLNFEANVLEGLASIREKMQYVHLADSLCFDFQKLGQTPYLTSLFLTKDGSSLGLLDLEEFETPYVGNRGYGSYHTGYTLECSRMASSIAIYAALQAFGVEGYQQILANYVRVNLAFRERIEKEFTNVAVINPTIGPVSVFRMYAEKENWQNEVAGKATAEEIAKTNELNNQLFEILGRDREEYFFGDTKKVCLIDAVDSKERHPVYAAKLFTISPYTETKHMDEIMEFLIPRIAEALGVKQEEKELELTY